MKILIVEDEKNISMLYEGELSELGYEIEIANSGSEAIELFKRGKYDLVTLDLRLPDIEGKEVLRQMKNYNKYVPIIIVSAYDLRSDDFYYWGAEAYLVKSSQVQDLVDTVKSVLDSEYVELKVKLRRKYIEDFNKLYNQNEKQVRKKIEEIIEESIRSYLLNIK